MPTSPPSQLQTGIGGLLTGLATGIGNERKAQQQAAYQQAMFGQQQALADKKNQFTSEQNELNRSVKERVAGMAGGGEYKLGQLLGLDVNDPRYNIAVTSKQAPMITVQGLNATKPSAGESKNTDDAFQMATLGSKLGKQWKKFGFDKGTGGQAAAGLVAERVPSRFSQHIVDPNYTDFDNTKKLLSETALRVATGAATNDGEIKTYHAFLPEPGDTPQIASGKIDNFFTRVSLRGDDTARRLESQGLTRQAAAHRKNVSDKLSAMKAQMMMDFGAAPTPTPTTAPAPGANPIKPPSKGAARLAANGF